MKAILFSLLLLLLPARPLFSQPSDALHGLVVGPDGIPISGAEVWATQVTTANTDALTAFGRADGSGQYRFRNLPEGDYVLTALVNGQKAETLSANLSPTLLFEITGSLDGRGEIAEVRTRVIVDPNQLVPARVTVVGQSLEVVLVALKSAVTVSGRVVILPAMTLPEPLKVSLSGESVRLNASSFFVQADGSFELHNVPPGKYLLRLVPNMGIPPQPITVSDQSLSGIELGGAAHGVRVSGRLTGYEAAGNPGGSPGWVYLVGEDVALLQNASSSVLSTLVTASSSDASRIVTVPQMVGVNESGEQSDLPMSPIGAGGKFEFLSIPPGRYYLRTTPDKRLANTTITVKDVEIPDFQAGAGVRVRGDVVPTNLGTRPPETIRLTEIGANGPAVSAVINQYGSFEFPSVGPGTYRVLLDNRTRPTPSEITVEDRDTIVRVEAPFGSWVRGRTTFSGTTPIPEIVTAIHVAMNNGYESALNPDGSFRLPSNDGEYDFFVKDLPEGYVVKSAFYGSESVLTGPVRVNASTPESEILLTLEYKGSALIE